MGENVLNFIKGKNGINPFGKKNFLETFLIKNDFKISLKSCNKFIMKSKFKTFLAFEITSYKLKP